MEAQMTTPVQDASRPASGPTREFMLLIVCGCLIAAATMGVRSAFGLFTDPLVLDKGWTRETYALAMAIQNLCWGIGTPLAGIFVDRLGPVPVFAVGGVLYALGLGLMPFGATPPELYLTAGVMVGLGQGASSQFIVLAVFSRRLPEQHRPWALGIGTAAASLGQFAFVPLGQVLIDLHGWSAASLALAAAVGVVPVLGVAFARPGTRLSAATRSETLPTLQAVRWAFGHPSYVWLFTGFFVCGFQLAFITIHLPPYLNDVGAGASLAAWAIGVVGLFNIAGSYYAGTLSGRLPKRSLLSLIYFARGIAIALYILLPVSVPSTIVFAAAMGLLWLSTVPPTSALISAMFGTGNIATLFGLVFLSHQVGSFLGVWLGGVLYEATGSYTVVWWLTVALAMFAALVHLPISERPAPRFATA
jgi:predicted MFS family arabinose efflux permease